MRRSVLPLGLAAILFSPLIALAQADGRIALDTSAAPAGPGLTLPQAIAAAEFANAGLRLRQAEIDAANGVVDDANAAFDTNPELSGSLTRRRAPSDAAGVANWNEWNAGLRQTVEVAGQRGYRRSSANLARSALTAEIEDARLRARAEATDRFYRVLALQRRVALETQAQKLFDDTAAAVQKRRKAGEDTRLDANVATVEAERARNQLAIAGEQLLNARSDLATTLQLAPEALPEVTGDLQSTPVAYQLPELLSAAERQPRLRALTTRESSAEARLNLERAKRYPDVTIGVNAGREGPATNSSFDALGIQNSSSGRERLATISLSVPLPLFKRNQLGVGQAATQLNQAQIERQTTQRDIRAAVLALWSRLQSLELRIRRLQESVVPALDDNQALSIKSRAAGQIALLELIVVNRQALDARRDLLDAQTEYQTTRAALELAAGWQLQGIPR